jgi:hypothetical protein
MVAGNQRSDSYFWGSSLQPPLFALYAHRILVLSAQEILSVCELASTLLALDVSVPVSTKKAYFEQSSGNRKKGKKTHRANKAFLVPLAIQRLHHHVRDGLPTPPAFGAVPVRVAIDTPRVPVLLHKRRLRIERVAALRAEEVADVPLGAARDNDLALDGRLARLAARREELVVVQVAVEAHALVAVGRLQPRRVLRRRAGRQGHVVAVDARADARHALLALRCGLRVERHALQVLVAVVAREALRVEARAGRADDAARDGKRAVAAQRAVAADGGSPVRLGNFVADWFGKGFDGCLYFSAWGWKRTC